MAAQTEKLPDFDLRSIEYMEIPCDIKVAIFFNNKISPARQCDNPAKWSGQYSCCGRIVLVCEDHFSDSNPYYCSTCSRHHKNLTNWTRL